MNKDEMKFIREQRGHGKTWAEIALSFGKHEEALRSLWRRAREEMRQRNVYDIPDFRQPIGSVSDTHLCSDFAREDALKSIYARFVDDGIHMVLHGGNIVEGYIPRINGGSVKHTSIDGQVQYVIDNYPSHSGIRTLFITGDDHEGWWQKEGFSFGQYLESTAIKQGRNDLKYLGHVEADIGLGHGQVLRLMHPGGGSAYARSYCAQKLVESFEGGEKPAILVLGHYHISDFCNERNVYCVTMPGLQSQSIFGRKKRLRMEVGGAILRYGQDEDDGHIARMSCEFMMFYDRKFYKRFLTSDKSVELVNI